MSLTQPRRLFGLIFVLFLLTNDCFADHEIAWDDKNSYFLVGSSKIKRLSLSHQLIRESPLTGTRPFKVIPAGDWVFVYTDAGVEIFGRRDLVKRDTVRAKLVAAHPLGESILVTTSGKSFLFFPGTRESIVFPRVTSFADWTPSGRRIALSFDNRVELWSRVSATDYRLKTKLPLLVENVIEIIWSPSGAELGIRDYSGYKVWDANRNIVTRTVISVHDASHIRKISWVQLDGTWRIVFQIAQGYIETNNSLISHDGRTLQLPDFYNFAVSPTGQQIAVVKGLLGYACEHDAAISDVRTAFEKAHSFGHGLRGRERNLLINGLWQQNE